VSPNTLSDATTSQTLRTPAAPRRAPSRPAQNHVAADPLRSSFAVDQILFHMRDALVVADVCSGRIVRWNPAAERLFGYTMGEAIGRPIDMLMPAAVARVHRERISHYARTGEAHVLAVRAPIGVPALARNGRELCVELGMVPLDLAGSPRRSVLLIFRDVGCQDAVAGDLLDS
jgi:PAS domain S-box-containing protein